MKKQRLSSRFNKTFVIRQNTATGKGIDRAETWEDVCVVWGSIRPVSASEILKSNREQLEITHRIKIRYRAGLTRDMQVCFGSRVFDINSIINIDEANKEIEILAKESA